MSQQPKTLITVATYNEMENLPTLIEAISEQAPDADILVVDDASPDGTGEWCDVKHAEDPRVRCLHREGKLGLGTAIIAGMKYAVEHGYDRVLNMDADFSHHPRYIPAMLALTEGDEAVDVSIGSRYVAGGGTVGWPWHRRFMSSSVNTYARLFLGLESRDCSGAFRCYTTAALKRIDLDRVISRGYSFQEEILWHLRRAGCTMAETPIMFADRERGQSKINHREAVAALWIIFRLGIVGLPRR